MIVLRRMQRAAVGMQQLRSGDVEGVAERGPEEEMREPCRTPRRDLQIPTTSASSRRMTTESGPVIIPCCQAPQLNRRVPPMSDKPITHLSVFAVDADTQAPSTRIPVYAEIALPKDSPRSHVEGFDDQFAEAGGFELDPAGVSDLLVKIEAAMSRRLTAESVAALKGDYSAAVDFFRAAVAHVADELHGLRVEDVSGAELTRIAGEAVERGALVMGLEMFDVHSDAIWTAPLGVLWTDHNGYLSYDLRRLPAEAKALLETVLPRLRAGLPLDAPVEIRVLPYGAHAYVDVLGQRRFADGAIVGRVPVSYDSVLLRRELPDHGGASLQYPDLVDWQLSPSSFASNPGRLVGEEGCELLFPASMPLHEFIVRQVVRLSDGDPRIKVAQGYRAAFVDEYRVTWTALGHSLGEILYSLPLAPGESVKLAVIDWSWESATSRDEKTVLTEELMHQTHRERSISETMQAGLREYQHGSSFMGGYAHSSGASGGATLGIVSLGAVVGNAWSAGGSTASSFGSRDLAAQNTQRLSDSFAQASASERELNSTIIVQARQDESENIETRTFTNYNRAHTLTILYYEVLRHYRLAVEWVRRRPAVLVPYSGETKYEWNTLLKHRNAIESALLDTNLAEGFSAIQKLMTVQDGQELNGVTEVDKWLPAPWEGDIEFSLFEFGIKTAGGTGDTLPDDGVVWIDLHYIDDAGAAQSTRLLIEGKSEAKPDANQGARFTDTAMAWFTAKPDKPVSWHQIAGFKFVLAKDDPWRMTRLAIAGFSEAGVTPLIETPKDDPGPGMHVDLYFLRDGSTNTHTWIRRPSPRPAPIPPTWGPAKSLSPDEYRAANALLSHVNDNIAHYNRAVVLAKSTAAISVDFETRTWTGGATLADVASPSPLDIFGTSVAYPLNIDFELNDEEAAKLREATSERLVSMPTRGVFGEGKLGHCSVAEEIDNTRFWKWEEHPIPFEAPEIGTIAARTPSPQPVAVTPTAFPSAVVTVQAPPDEPSPSGLAAALAAITTPDTFRDMSGRGEVADLLKKLADKTIDAAEAATKAQAIQTKYGEALDKNDADVQTKAIEEVSKVAQKQVEANAPIKNAQARAAEAAAAQQETKATKDAIELAKDVPPKYRAPIYEAGAQQASGNATKSKALVFKAFGYDGQQLLSPFTLVVREVGTHRSVVNEEVGGYFDKQVEFSSATPGINVGASRKGTAPIQVFGQVFQTTPINVVNSDGTFQVGAKHRTIDVELRQGSVLVKFKAVSTAQAVDELVKRSSGESGGNIGIGAEYGAKLDVGVATKLIQGYESKNGITHADNKEIEYSMQLPAESYSLKITSK